jgi:hypothetical protein
MGLLAGPILMFFGCFYLPVVIVLHLVAWWAWPWWKELGLGRIGFGLIGAIVGASLFALIGVKEAGHVQYFTIANAVAAAIAAFASCLTIATIRKTATGPREAPILTEE